MVPPPGTFFFSSDLTVRSFKTSARQNTANIHVTQSLRLCGQISEKSVLKSQFWKNTLQCRKRTPLQVFKTKYSTFQNVFLNVWTPVCRIPFTRFQNREQWNTLLEQCQIWNSANALVKLFELWKCVSENDEEDKIEHKIMFTDVWILVLVFFRL